MCCHFNCFDVWWNVGAMQWIKSRRLVPFCNSVMFLNTKHDLRITVIILCSHLNLHNIKYTSFSLVWRLQALHLLSRLQDGSGFEVFSVQACRLRYFWRLSGKGSSKMPLGSSPRTKRLLLMATLHKWLNSQGTLLRLWGMWSLQSSIWGICPDLICNLKDRCLTRVM